MPLDALVLELSEKLRLCHLSLMLLHSPRLWTWQACFSMHSAGCQYSNRTLSPTARHNCFCKVRWARVRRISRTTCCNQRLGFIKRNFSTLKAPTEYHVSFTAHQFIGAAITWWETLGYTYDTQDMDWEAFENLIKESYFNAHHCRTIYWWVWVLVL